ncbi:MAG: hypothetical protein HYY84_06530 [Deltaproteobacteria bacterium]|nr:hypothetical protein [Deltaproteobacteria bacterium]
MLRILTFIRRRPPNLADEYRAPADRIAVTVFGAMLSTWGAIMGLWALITLVGCDLWVDTAEVKAPRVDTGAVDGGGTTPVSDGGVDAGPATVSYAATVQPILANSCGACHSGSSPQAGLDVTTYAGLVTQQLERGIIVPGDPAGSVLVQRIANGSMPPAGLPSPTASELDTIKAWITSGAPNN